MGEEWQAGWAGSGRHAGSVSVQAASAGGAWSVWCFDLVFRGSGVALRRCDLCKIVSHFMNFGMTGRRDSHVRPWPLDLAAHLGAAACGARHDGGELGLVAMTGSGGARMLCFGTFLVVGAARDRGLSSRAGRAMALLLLSIRFSRSANNGRAKTRAKKRASGLVLKPRYSVSRSAPEMPPSPPSSLPRL
jgi:hypothetical protein